MGRAEGEIYLKYFPMSYNMNKLFSNIIFMSIYSHDY